MLKIHLENRGYPSVIGHVIEFREGNKDFRTFLKKNDPKVIIFDIAPPYEKNWEFFLVLKKLKEMEGRYIVLTTTNKRVLEKLVGKTKAYEVVGKPFDIGQIIDAVEKAK